MEFVQAVKLDPMALIGGVVLADGANVGGRGSGAIPEQIISKVKDFIFVVICHIVHHEEKPLIHSSKQFVGHQRHLVSFWSDPL